MQRGFTVVCVSVKSHLTSGASVRLENTVQRGFTVVCVSVKSHLTSRASVRLENTVTYSAGNGGQKICGVFSETTQLQRSSTPSVEGHVQSAIFMRNTAHVHYSIYHMWH